MGVIRSPAFGPVFKGGLLRIGGITLQTRATLDTLRRGNTRPLIAPEAGQRRIRVVFEIFHNRFCEFCEFNKSYSRKSQSSMEPAKLTLRRFTTPGPKSAISLDFPCITGKTPAFAPAENTGAGSKGNRIFGITAPTTAIFRKKRIIPAGIRSKYRAKIFPLIRKSRIFAHQINEKEEKMKADSITSPIRKQGFRASMTVKW